MKNTSSVVIGIIAVFVIISAVATYYWYMQVRINDIPNKYQECIVECISKLRLNLPPNLDAASVESMMRDACIGICLEKTGYQRSLEDGSDPNFDTSGNYCESDEECTCQGFTGGGFTPESSPSDCDVKENRCFQCGYA